MLCAAFMKILLNENHIHARNNYYLIILYNGNIIFTYNTSRAPIAGGMIIKKESLQWVF
jgi:hypothetical protein